MRNDDSDDNYVSTRKWMLLMLVPSIPVIGWILVFVFACTGNNQTRKNYFRALIAWVLLVAIAIVAFGVVLAHSPALLQQIKNWQPKHH